MRPFEIEAWVLRVLDALTRGQQTEDSRVELKREWPLDAASCARRIAGLANAAHGEPVLWIIGADENARTVTGADHKDLANWYPSIRACFDQIAPEPTDLIVSYGGTPVVALMFSTDRAPYVVKNPTYGTQGVYIEREVPWRAQTSVRSATREDLIRILVPALSCPTAEVLKAEVGVSVMNREASHDWEWCASLHLYVVPADERRVVIPYHHCAGALTVSEEPDSAAMTIPFKTISVVKVAAGLGVFGSNTEAVIEGPCGMTVQANACGSPLRPAVDQNDLRLRFALQPIRADRPIVVEATMPPRPDSKLAAEWPADPLVASYLAPNWWLGPRAADALARAQAMETPLTFPHYEGRLAGRVSHRRPVPRHLRQLPSAIWRGREGRRLQARVSDRRPQGEPPARASGTC
jgi:hypothetical protein